jgi:hypothetical protein
MNVPNPRSSLAGFLSEYPLYSKFGINQPIEAADLDKLEFEFFCKNENAMHNFRLEAGMQNGNGRHVTDCVEGAIVDFTEIFSGICQSCKEYKIDIILSGGTQKETPKYFIRKIGQFPAPETSLSKLPNEMAVFLNNGSRELYSKALKNLDMEYGTGAFAYFKRVIENEMGRIIGAVSNPWSDSQKKINEAISVYKLNGQKSQSIEDISPHLPETLKEHGANILLLLHDVVLTNIHELTEEECMKKSKDIDALLRYLVKKLESPEVGKTERLF